MRRFTEEELQRANDVDLLAYVRSRGYAVRRAGSQHCLAEHDSLVIRGNKWYWFSRHMGGKTIDFLVQYEGFSFPEAVRTLLGEEGRLPRTVPKAVQHQAPERPRRLLLPPMAKSNVDALAYLRRRGIAPEVLQACLDRCSLYQADSYRLLSPDGRVTEHPGKQAVFLGFDQEGTPRYACSRSLDGNGKHDAPGSDKSYAFSLPSSDPNCQTLWVFESAIDALSHATLQKQNPWPVHRISLGGLAPLALERFLRDHPKIRYINLGLDRDEQGRRAAEALRRSLSERTAQDASGKQLIVVDCPPVHGKDYNDALLYRMRTRSHIAER